VGEDWVGAPQAAGGGRRAAAAGGRRQRGSVAGAGAHLGTRTRSTGSRSIAWAASGLSKAREQSAGRWQSVCVVPGAQALHSRPSVDANGALDQRDASRESPTRP
jgi:hypothetical protein